MLGSNLNNYGWYWLDRRHHPDRCGDRRIERRQFSRWIGIIAAAIAALSAMVWMPYYPVWSLIYVAIAFFVLYGWRCTAAGKRWSSGPDLNGPPPGGRPAPRELVWCSAG